VHLNACTLDPLRRKGPREGGATIEKSRKGTDAKRSNIVSTWWKVATNWGVRSSRKGFGRGKKVSGSRGRR